MTCKRRDKVSKHDRALHSPLLDEPSKKFRSQLGRSDVAATSTKVAAMSLRPPSRPKLLQRRRRCDVPPRHRHQVARRCRCDIAVATQSSVKVATATSQRCRKYNLTATSTKVAAISLRPPSRPKLLQRRRRCDVPPRHRHQVTRRCRCDIASATQSSVKVATATSQRCRKFSQKVATAMLPRRSTSYINCNCTCGKALSNACKDVLHHTHQIMQSNLVKGPMID